MNEKNVKSPMRKNFGKIKKEIEDKKKEMICRDEGATSYDAFIEKSKYKYYYYVKIKATIERLNPSPTDIILDIGVSTGKLAIEYALNCHQIIATDFSLNSLLYLRQRFQSQNITNYNLILLDACFLPFKDNSVNKVLYSTVLHHIPSFQMREQSLQEIRRTLRPNGKLVISVYNYNILKRISKFLPDKIKLHSDVEKEHHHLDGIYYYNYADREFLTLLKQYFITEECRGILNRIPWLTSRSGKYGMFLDRFLEKTFVSRWLGHLLLVKCSNKSKFVSL